jgi:hypothetical protein
MQQIKKHTLVPFILFMLTLLFAACHDLLDEPAENRTFTGETDYTQSGNMILPLIGTYAKFYDIGWETYPLISVRGDDVNAGGKGDQPDFTATDNFHYNKDAWLYNSLWESFYSRVFTCYSAIDQIELYRKNGADSKTANQYIAEIKTIRAFLLFQLSRVWGDIFIPPNYDPTRLLETKLSTKEQVMQFISDEMTDAVNELPDTHPRDRRDIPGGVTKYAALAMKALANLELENYQAVADATAQIIQSKTFELESDFYELFKLKGKLNEENILEFQYSDFGQGSGDRKSFLWAFFGPQSWTPAKSGIGGGWGFYEPSLKYIKFMIDRGEKTRLETSVLFTNRGITEIKKDSKYANLPEWISNRTKYDDVIGDFDRALFSSGKHYLPSEQIIDGRTEYGSNKNMQLIRYSEILLMYAEALTRGASVTGGMTAADAVNLVRDRAGLGRLSNVTSQDVIDEKFAELGMEWGTRYYDMLRLKKYEELVYDGRTFTPDHAFLPYPQNQVDQLPALRGK